MLLNSQITVFIYFLQMPKKTVVANICVGDGSYSSVYKVRRIIDGQMYALKKVKVQNLSEKEKENALNEVRILASVKNPFVASYK